MKAILEQVKCLALDLFVFSEMVMYWPFALIVMKPAQYLDRRFGTSVFSRLDCAMRRIADL